MSDTPESPAVDRLTALITSSTAAYDKAWLAPDEKAARLAEALRLAWEAHELDADDMLMPGECSLCHQPVHPAADNVQRDEAGLHHDACLHAYHAPAMAAARSAVKRESARLEVTSEDALAYDANDPKNPTYLDALLDRADNSRATQ